jgi:drug/metabolite transporter (DMT)-like permease
VIAGAALGAFNSMSNVFGSAYGPFTTTPEQGVLWLEYVSAWLGSAWAWAMFAFTVGWLTRRPGPAVFRAVLGLLVAVVAYYFFDRALGMTGAVEVSLMVFWSLIALFVAPLMALLGVFGRKPNRWSLLAGLAAPILISSDALVRPTGPDHIRPWSQWLVLCAAAGLALIFVGRAARLERRRPALPESHSGRV